MPVTNIVEEKCSALLEEAIRKKSSDIHFIPKGEQYTIYLQKHYQLYPFATYPLAMTERMVSYFKFLSSLDMSDIVTPQSGSFHRKIADEMYSFRVSTIPSYYRESVVIRIQKHNEVMTLNELANNDKRTYEALERLTTYDEGLVLVNGPTGSGKTTTLYTLLAHCVFQHERHVITLEDPVENPQEHLLQVQVNERAGLTYATGLKAVLRHSPNVIMIGEIRDALTAKTAARAALSGHLVFSTVHAKNPEGSLYRLLDLDVTFDELQQTVVALLSQRLHNDNGRRYATFQIVQQESLDVLFQRMRRRR